MTTSTELQRGRREAVLPLQHFRAQIDTLLSAIENGSRDIETILVHDVAERAIDLTYIAKLIEVVPGVGKVGARQLLARLDISETARTGDLTSAQRGKIAELVKPSGVDQS